MRGIEHVPLACRRLAACVVAVTLVLSGTAACGSSEKRPAQAGAPTSTPTGSPNGSPNGTAQPSVRPTGTQATGGGAATTAAPPGAPAGAELPRGGRTLLPAYRLVGFAGRPNAEELGRLGIGSLSAKGAEIEKQARPYAAGRKILPVFELIATVAHGSPGPDKMYRGRSGDAMIRTHLMAARKAKGILLLDIQPGRADFLTEVKAYERWLREPDVGVALDPEWAMKLTGGVPGKRYGKTTGAELDGVAAYLSGLVKTHNLPEKVMVFHQVAASVVTGESGLRDHPGVVSIKSVDGIGNPAMKRETWRALTQKLAPHVKTGFKLFYREDTEGSWPLMTPKQVMALRPTPDYVMYE